MSDRRDPRTDQPLPEGGGADVQQVIINDLTLWNLDTDVRKAIEQGIIDRRALGIRKYGQPVRVGNGRDALQDAWEEALDLFTYCYQASLEDIWHESLMFHAKSVLEELTLMRLRGRND